MSKTVTALALLLIAMAVCVGLAIARPNRLRKLTDEEKIQMTLTNIARAMCSEQADGLSDVFSRAYKEDGREGHTYGTLSKALADFARKYDGVENKPICYIYDSKIAIDGTSASIDCKIILTAQNADTKEMYTAIKPIVFSMQKTSNKWSITGSDQFGELLQPDSRW